MALFGKTNSAEGGFMDVIRCDLPEYLVWKWRPDAAEAGGGDGGRHGVNATVKENAIRYGSSLRVKEGEVAVFVYNQKDGPLQDFIEGPYDGQIKTANFPVLARIVGVGFGGASPFQAEVYFMNLAGINQISFGVPFFDVFDPRFLDFAVPVAVRGKMTFKLSDYKGFIKLHRLINFDLEDFKAQVKSAISKYVKAVVSNAPTDHGIPVLQLERKILDINDLIFDHVKNRLESDFGVSVSAIDIDAIESAKDSEGYQKLMEVTRDLAAQTAQAQTDINIENMSESMRIQRKAAEMQVEGANFAVHQLNQQTMVAKTAAESLGQLGGGGDGGGSNFAGMMAGVAMGGMAGAQMGGMMGGMMQGMQQQPGAMPPPPPVVQYSVAVNGQTTGPFNMDQLRQMVQSGQLTDKSTVWKAGMAGWVEAGTVQELAVLFSAGAPPPPPPPPPPAQ